MEIGAIVANVTARVDGFLANIFKAETRTKSLRKEVVELNKMMKFGGVGIFGNQFARATSEMEKAAEEFAAGTMGAKELTAELVRGLPVLGQWVQGWDSFNAAMQRVGKEMERRGGSGNRFIDWLLKPSDAENMTESEAQARAKAGEAANRLGEFITTAREDAALEGIELQKKAIVRKWEEVARELDALQSSGMSGFGDTYFDKQRANAVGAMEAELARIERQQFEKEMDEVERLREKNAAEWERAQKEAERRTDDLAKKRIDLINQVWESTRTPLEHYRDRLEELKAMGLDPETLGRAVAAARKDFMGASAKGGGKGGSVFAGALDFLSPAAYSATMAAYGDNEQDKLAREQLEATRRAADGIDRLVGITQPPAPVMGLP